MKVSIVEWKKKVLELEMWKKGQEEEMRKRRREDEEEKEMIRRVEMEDRVRKRFRPVDSQCCNYNSNHNLDFYPGDGYRTRHFRH